MISHSARACMTTAVLLTSVAMGLTPPHGFEIVQITNNPADNANLPRINNCGEVVCSVRMLQSEDSEEIFLYDNGRFDRLTVNGYRDALPDINDHGAIVWTRGIDGFGGGTIVLFQDGTLTGITTAFRAVINNLGHIAAWHTGTSEPCDASPVLLYDGTTIHTIVDNRMANRGVEINDQDELVWVRLDMCAPSPHDPYIMRYSDGIISEIAGGQYSYALPHINNLGWVTWQAREEGGEHFIEIWVDGVTTTLPDWGMGPRLNNRGDISFFRRYDDASTYDMWLRFDGWFYRLTDEPAWHVNCDINDASEVVWEGDIDPPDSGDIYFLRRIRTGDMDFDFDVDLDDFATFRDCMTGPIETDRLCQCRFLDIDHDRDVDMDDYLLLLTNFTGTRG